MRDFLQLADKIIKCNCSVLVVPIPTVRIAEPSEFATPTVKSVVSTDGRGLLINRQFAESEADELFVWLALSHECRHIWQAHNSQKFDSYQTSATLPLVEYNAQPEEIDAWAWAVIVTGQLFGIRPTLEKNFGAEVWAQIEQRIQQIATEGLF